MARTYTKEMPLGNLAPDFSLIDVVSNTKKLFSSIQGEKGTLVMFICNHCPFVIHVRLQLVELANDYLSKGIGFVAISSNDVVNYPDDSPEKMKELALELKFPFPYLYDETQAVAKVFDAACTPDFYVFDQKNTLQYRGQFDDSRPGNGIEVSGIDLGKAIKCILEDQKNSENQINLTYIYYRKVRFK